MFRKTILALAATSILATTSAFAAELSPTQKTWVSKVKACLVQNKVEITGDRPQCYISDEFRIRCLTPALGAIGAKCNSGSLPPAGNRL